MHDGASASLTLNQATFEAIVGAATEGVVVIDATGRIRFVNPMAEQLFDQPAADLVGRDVSTLMPAPFAAEHAAYLSGHAARGSKAADSRVMGEGREVAGRRRDGSTVPLRLVVREVAGAGRERLFVGYLSDLTERKRQERSRLEMIDAAMQAQKMEALGTLASGVAHDVGNVLSLVMAHAEISLERQTDVATRDSLTQIMAACGRAGHMIRQILAFSAHEEPSREVIDLGQLMREVGHLVCGKRPPGVVLDIQESSEPCLVECEATKVHQLLLNLCINAVQSLTEGGRVTVSLTNMDLDPNLAARLSRGAAVGHLEAGPWARLSISDTGCGIGADCLPRIFEPFFTTKRGAAGGTGLGLAAVRGIALAHRGAVTVTSKPGGGTTFNVYLPMPGNPVADVQKPPPGMGGLIEVLVIEPRVAALEVFREALPKAGYLATTFDAALPALESFAADPWRYRAVVLGSASMDMPWQEVMARLRQIRADLPVLVCTPEACPTGLPPASTKAALAPGASAGCAILCLHGLLRQNAADGAVVA